MNTNNEALKNKYGKWLEKAMSGDPEYTLIAYDDGNGKWYHICSNHSEVISEMKIAVDAGYGEGMKVKYCYNIKCAETNCQWCTTMIIKNESKLIINIGENYSSFGVKNGNRTLAKFYAYIRTTPVHKFVYASQECERICIQYSPAISDRDAVTYCVEEIFATPTTVSNFDETKVNHHE